MFSIEKFAKRFSENYNFLYENRDNVAGYHDAVAWYDNHANAYRGLISQFVQYRGDFISSDREAAAFAFTVKDFNLIDKKPVASTDHKISLEYEIYEQLRNADTKIAQKVFGILDRNGIAGIIADTEGKVFWFEHYASGNRCPKDVYEWLKKYIKRTYGYSYLYDVVQ